MKKLIITTAMLLAGFGLFGQRYYYKAPHERLLNYQVGVHAVNYGENMMVGFHIGGNVGEYFNLTYFLVRDYQVREGTAEDLVWRGVKAAMMLPVGEKLDFGPVVAHTRFRGEKENKLFWGIEARYELKWNTKLAVFYGKGDLTGTGVKLIWNLY